MLLLLIYIDLDTFRPAKTEMQTTLSLTLIVHILIANSSQLVIIFLFLAWMCV